MWIRQYSVNMQYVYFVSTGVSLFLFNYGQSHDIYHSLICIIFIYFVLQFLAGTMLSVILAFLFLMSYLLLGYYYTAQGDYDLSWSLPQCILTLKLIGLVWDVFDGRRNEELSDEQKKTALKDIPGLLEIAAYVYFFSGFLVGPQFPLVRLRSLVNGEFDDPETGFPRKNTFQCLHRLILGFIYMALYVILYGKLTEDYFLSDQFKAQNLLWKCLLACIWFRLIISRYIACWLAVEGSCILVGLSYNGQDTATRKALWDGLRNIRTTKFELGCTFQSVIESFNINTNQWASRYVFKRLKFLGNKSLSHVMTLMFLALWHGVYSGYFACFLFEYACVIAERQISSIVQYYPWLDELFNRSLIKYPVWIFKKTLVTFGCAYGLLPFILLKFDVWWQVYKNLYFVGWLLYGVVWQVIFALFGHFIKSRRTRSKRE
uniref:Lysophospholipid acyltransferase 5 n=1 Tax=Romanomermis culicivorax TaxID=13658 RepID=A0A915JXS8_ROMCU